ncbi:hypothetical protein IFHNHDMJ_01856 [Synechococcus sp. CBW1107]|nr:hypothetical protein IFHNHDMJ_01856 [Synechococcus sp. CBW1107]
MWTMGLRSGLVGSLVAAALLPLLRPALALAQNQPYAVQGLPAYPPCPLVVPKSQSLFQPLRLRPSQVASKNARGCLSQADAIYGSNGCPTRLCPRDSGAFQLTPPGSGNPIAPAAR